MRQFKRDYTLDVVRIVACLMVVFMHSPIPSDNANGAFLTVLSYATAPCIGLFFIVSGALLMPVTGDYITFVRKRLGKVVGPTLFWTAIYIGFYIYNSESEINLLRKICSIPFCAQGHGVLWFMYTLIGLYLISPILSAWLNVAKRSEIEIVLGFWAITLCYPLLGYVVDVNSGTTGVFYYFTGYAGYFLLGWYMKRYETPKLTLIAGVIAVVGPIVLFLFKRYGIEYNFYTLFWYESIFIAAMSVIVWKLIHAIVTLSGSGKISAGVVEVSNLSFGIYLIHILIMREWLWKQSWIIEISNYILQTLLIAVLTFVFSTISVALISRLPKAQYIIGYKH